MTQRQAQNACLVEREGALVSEDPAGTMDHTRISSSWSCLHPLDVRFKRAGVERLGREHTTLTISKG